MLIALLCTAFLSTFAQKEERQNIRKGNKMYEQEKYTEAEIDYRKSQDVNPTSPQAAFNLGNALYRQEKYEDAIKQFGIAAQNSNTDQTLVSEAFYNSGNVFMEGQDYAKAIQAYKQTLRLNPKDNEARYNLALAQKLLSDQENDQNQDQDQEQQDQDQQQNQDQEQNNNQEQQQDQDQNQQDQEQQDQDESQQQQHASDQISKEVAEQILNALNQDEKGVQEKVRKAQMDQMQRRKSDKDW